METNKNRTGQQNYLPGREPIKEHFYKSFVKISAMTNNKCHFFLFSHYKSMAILKYHTCTNQSNENQNLLRLIQRIFLQSLSAMFHMDGWFRWNLVLIGQAASEEMSIEIMQKHCIKSSSNICFGYMLESPKRGNSNKYPKHMFYEEIRIKQGLFYLSFCPLKILYNSNFIIMAMSLGTNAVVVTRVHCNCFLIQELTPSRKHAYIILTPLNPTFI